MTTTITEDDIPPQAEDIDLADAVEDIEHIVAPRSRSEPTIIRHSGPVINIVRGSTAKPWRTREHVLADRHSLHLVHGDCHDAIDRSNNRPVEIKCVRPIHSDGDRERNGCLFLRRRQHETLMNVPEDIQDDHGLAATGDYLFCVHARLGDLLILLDTGRISAGDLDRLTDPSFYDASGKGEQACVNWSDLSPLLSVSTMHQRLDNAAVRIEAIGEDPDEYHEEIERVRRDVNRADPT